MNMKIKQRSDFRIFLIVVIAVTHLTVSDALVDKLVRSKRFLTDGDNSNTHPIPHPQVGTTPTIPSQHVVQCEVYDENSSGVTSNNCSKDETYCMNVVEFDESGKQTINKKSCANYLECKYDHSGQDCAYTDISSTYNHGKTCQFCCVATNDSYSCNRNPIPTNVEWFGDTTPPTTLDPKRLRCDTCEFGDNCTTVGCSKDETYCANVVEFDENGKTTVIKKTCANFLECKFDHSGESCVYANGKNADVRTCQFCCLATNDPNTCNKDTIPAHVEWFGDTTPTPTTTTTTTTESTTSTLTTTSTEPSTVTSTQSATTAFTLPTFTLTPKPTSTASPPTSGKTTSTIASTPTLSTTAPTSATLLTTSVTTTTQPTTSPPSTSTSPSVPSSTTTVKTTSAPAITLAPNPTTTTASAITLAPKPTTTTSSAITLAPNPTTTTSSAITLAPKPTTTTASAITLAPNPTTTHAPTLSTAKYTGPRTTTKKQPYTLPPVTTVCETCSGPVDICDILYQPTNCDPPNNYCINKIVNNRNGEKTVNRTCGDFSTCYNDWFLGSSDNDKCRTFDEHSVVTLDFTCTFCCIHDQCNKPLRPATEDLYNDY